MEIDLDVLPARDESEARLADVGQKIENRLPTGSLSSWWGDRVAHTPDNLVLKTDTHKLTYSEIDALVARMRAFIAENPKDRHGIHRYSPEEYGVDPDRVREFFRPHLNGPLRSRARSVLARHAVSGDHP